MFIHTQTWVYFITTIKLRRMLKGKKNINYDTILCGVCIV
jgi:hypothetical protein